MIEVHRPRKGHSRTIMSAAAGLCLAVVASAATALVPEAAGAATPPINGKLLFANAANNIYSTYLNGEVSSTNTGHIGQSPRVSPDGWKIAYTNDAQNELEIGSTGPATHVHTAWTASTDRKIGAPSWSPDGTKVAFMVSTRVTGVGDLMVTDLNTANTTLLVGEMPSRGLDSSPSGVSYSPDGTTIAWTGIESSYEVYNDCVTEPNVCRWHADNSGIYSVDVQNHYITNIAFGSNLRQATWSRTAAGSSSILVVGDDPSIPDQGFKPPLTSFDLTASYPMEATVRAPFTSGGWVVPISPLSTQVWGRSVVNAALSPDGTTYVITNAANRLYTLRWDGIDPVWMPAADPTTNFASLTWAVQPSGTEPSPPRTNSIRWTAGNEPPAQPWKQPLQPQSWPDASRVAVSANGRHYAIINRASSAVLYASRDANGAFTAAAPLSGNGGAPFEANDVSIDADPGNTFVQVLAIGTDRRIWHRALTTSTGIWSPWALVDGTFQTTQVTLSVNKIGEAEVAAIGLDGKIWHQVRRANGSWTGFHNPPGLNGAGYFAAKRIVAEGGQYGNASNFAAIANDGRVYYTRRDIGTGKWDTWTLLPTVVNTVAMVSEPNGRVNLATYDSQTGVAYNQSKIADSWTAPLRIPTSDVSGGYANGNLAMSRDRFGNDVTDGIRFTFNYGK